MSITLSSGNFYGAIARKRELGSFRLTESTYRAHARVPAHTHQQPYLCFVLQGEYEETSGGHTLECEPWDVIFHPAGEDHADRFGGSGGRCFNLEAAERLMDRSITNSLLPESQRFRGGPMSWLFRRLHREFRQQDAAAPLAMEGLALELLAEVLRWNAAPEARAPRWLSQVQELLHARFAEPWTLAEIARSAEVHPAYLARSFRRHLGVTVGEYVRRLRVEFACRRLAADDAPLNGIAAEAGFADQSHFTRTFRRATGLTPARYRAARGGQAPSKG
ncbi:MAG TPA: AraC family transcriptional regulator [Terriglobales bacterium]|jgi:AraC family transcriptional regulator|nr:AraC family transcriptional regulator [Terriglobales bacterium]